MRRRTTFGLLALLAVATLVAAASLSDGIGKAGRFSSSRALCPGCNVVLISIDTLRADRLGAYGYQAPTSPNMDAFAADSAVFEDAISQSAWTRPAHASMFTGLYPREHGVIVMSRDKRLSPELPTLAGVLSASGYATAAFTGGANMAAHFGFGSGFDVYTSPGRRLEDNLPDAVEWMRGQRGNPFFLFLHGFDPHRPYKSEAVDREALGLPEQRLGGIQRACKTGSSPSDLAPYVAEYDATVHRADRSFGRLMEALSQMQLLDRTIVVLTSDHGEEFLEHGRCFHIRTLYAEVVRVPLIVSVPAFAPARIAGPVPASAAIAGTVLDLLGADRGGLDGPSLVSSLRAGTSQFESVYSETSSRQSSDGKHGHVRALTGRRYKIIDWVSQKRREIYDLERDPAEMRPLVDEALERELAARLDRWIERHPVVAAPVATGAPPRKVVRGLRALGYLD